MYAGEALSPVVPTDRRSQSLSQPRPRVAANQQDAAPVDRPHSPTHVIPKPHSSEFSNLPFLSTGPQFYGFT